jgi:hypothetical protein
MKNMTQTTCPINSKTYETLINQLKQPVGFKETNAVYR